MRMRAGVPDLLTNMLGCKCVAFATSINVMASGITKLKRWQQAHEWLYLVVKGMALPER
jgi:hypothetical protein